MIFYHFSKLKLYLTKAANRNLYSVKEKESASINSQEKDFLKCSKDCSQYFSVCNCKINYKTLNFKIASYDLTSKSRVLNNCLREKEKSKKISIKGYLTNNSLLLSFFPSLYLVSSILIILLLIFFKLHNQIRLVSDIKIKKFSFLKIIPNYFDLQKVNKIAFNIYIFLSCLSSTGIVIILYSVLKQRFKVPEFQVHSFKLNIMLLFGLSSNILCFIRAVATPFFNRYHLLIKDIKPNLEMDFNQMIFLLQIFFGILFSIYSLTILHLVKEKTFNHDYRNNYDRVENEIDNNKWCLFKYINLFYLSLLMLIYILFLMNNSKIINLGFLDEIVKNNYVFVIGIFPYFIHIINAILIFTFYFELKFVNLALAYNLDVDYLFEEDDKIGI